MLRDLEHRISSHLPNLHGDRRALKEMENEQRNRFLTEYVTQHFSEEFWQELQTAHLKEDAKQLLQQYT